MSANRSLNPIVTRAPNTIDLSPLLASPSPRAGGDDALSRFRSSGRRPSIRGTADYLRRAGSRRLMREPSFVVREAAAEQLEERQTDWAYSRPIVILDIVWNLVFIAAAAAVMVTSRNERPHAPLRLWVLGYSVQCLVHMICVCIKYRTRRRMVVLVRGSQTEGDEGGAPVPVPPRSPLSMPPRSPLSMPARSPLSMAPPPLQRSPSDLEEGAGTVVDGDRNEDEEGHSVAKHLEYANTVFSFIWWTIGFYWVSAGGSALTRQAPQLYWLCVVFLAFDVFFVVLCVALACLIGVAVCCCLPCIIALLYNIADQGGATDADIRQIPKYKFRRTSDSPRDISRASAGIMTECEGDPPREHVVSADDAECCICLAAYDDGVELRELPCKHHFHCTCIDKWLRINATCPLCKYSILKTNNQGVEEV